MRHLTTRWRRALILLVAGHGLLGCSSTSLTGRPEPWLGSKEVTTALRAGPIKTGSDSEPETFQYSYMIREYLAETDPTQRKSIRNNYITASVLDINSRYNEFVDRLGAGRKGRDTGAETSAIALDALSAAFTPAVTKTALSLASGIVTAGNVAINKNYFYEEALPVLIKQMEANRATVANRLLAGRKLSDDTYGLEAADSDLRAYYEAGTFEGALDQLANAAAEEESMALEQRSEELVESIKSRQESATETISRFKQSGDLAAAKKATTERFREVVSQLATARAANQQVLIDPLLNMLIDVGANGPAMPSGQYYSGMVDDAETRSGMEDAVVTWIETRSADDWDLLSAAFIALEKTDVLSQ